MSYHNPVEWTGNMRVEHPVKQELAPVNPSPFTVVGEVIYDPDTDELGHIFYTFRTEGNAMIADFSDTEYPDNGHGYRGSF